jgi:hypothetical protein
MRAKTSAQLDRDIAEFLAKEDVPKGQREREVVPLLAKRDATQSREINAILRAADGRNVYLIRHRLGDETVHRIAQAHVRGRVLEVRDLATGNWLPVLPERGDQIEVR